MTDEALPPAIRTQHLWHRYGSLDGGEGKLEDSGFTVEVDRVLVRVVGWGGVS